MDSAGLIRGCVRLMDAGLGTPHALAVCDRGPLRSWGDPGSLLQSVQEKSHKSTTSPSRADGPAPGMSQRSLCELTREGVVVLGTVSVPCTGTAVHRICVICRAIGGPARIAGDTSWQDPLRAGVSGGYLGEVFED